MRLLSSRLSACVVAIHLSGGPGAPGLAIGYYSAGFQLERCIKMHPGWATRRRQVGQALPIGLFLLRNASSASCA